MGYWLLTCPAVNPDPDVDAAHIWLISECCIQQVVSWSLGLTLLCSVDQSDKEVRAGPGLAPPHPCSALDTRVP